MIQKINFLKLGPQLRNFFDQTKTKLIKCFPFKMKSNRVLAFLKYIAMFTPHFKFFGSNKKALLFIPQTYLADCV